MKIKLAKCTLALVAKQKKTKFVTAHTVSYTSTKPRKEMIEAERREMDKRRVLQKAEIDANHRGYLRLRWLSLRPTPGWWSSWPLHL